LLSYCSKSDQVKSSPLEDNSQTPWFELSADEFSFNVNGHSGLFYLNPDGDWTVISDEDIVVEFDPSTGFLGWQDLNARFFNKLGQWAGRAENARWFKGFTLITPDGVRYEFGGVDAIDFKAKYDAKCGAPSAGSPKVFFKYFYVNTATGEKSGEVLAQAKLSE